MRSHPSVANCLQFLFLNHSNMEARYNLKMLFYVVSVLSFVSLSTAQDATATPTAATAAPVTEETIIGIGNRDVSCYTCDNVQDNDECNGVGLSENGSLTHCPFEQSNCFSIIKVNEAGDGYTAQKGCMEFDECYDRHYETSNDPILGGDCHRISVLGDPPIPATTECFYCCYAYEGVSLSMCNSAMGKMFLSLPTPNNWNPEVDKWSGHEPGESTEAPAVTAGGDAVLFHVTTTVILMTSALFI